ncbi:global transactivator [Fusarium bulbicola]|nr:global transactivator [Fusarium bulbicola]
MDVRYHYPAKRRRLEDSSTFTHISNPALDTTDFGSMPMSEVVDGNFQSLLAPFDNDNSCASKEVLFSPGNFPPPPNEQGPSALNNTGAASTYIQLTDSIETICFGTLTRMTLLRTNNQQSCLFGTQLRLGRDGTLQSLHLDHTYGALDTWNADLLDLFHREGIEYELLWMSEQLGTGAGTNDNPVVWATLYGPGDLASDLRDLFENLDLYLQDPVYALRDVMYFNPQRFSNEPHIRTSHFWTNPSIGEPVLTIKDETFVVRDVLDSITTGSTLYETPGSQYLLTELMSHQKQGLTFMIRRESGWSLHGNGQDVWSQIYDYHGRTTYINNVDSSLKYTQPYMFRGGIIADLMGLGKTLSIYVQITLPGDIIMDDGVFRIPAMWRLMKSSSRHTRHSQKSGEIKNRVRSFHITAHEVKDLSTSKARAVCALKASRRWVVTGTPIQNKLSELFSLFHFLRLDPYSERRSFDEAITNPWLNGEDRGLQALKRLLGYTMLRRSKNAIVLPPRKDHRRFLEFSTEERIAYDIAKQKAIDCLEDALALGDRGKGYSNALQKINALRALVEDLQNCSTETKSIVFSYRTSILDVANIALTSNGIGCVQIDGKVKARRRTQIIKKFSTDETMRVLLLSLGCGAVGLTLTAASRAYLLEPQWNPTIEEQALARIHRLGQTQEVTTVRFVIGGSIEQYVLDIQDGKRDLVSLLSTKNDGGQVMTKLQLLRKLLR